MQNKLVFSIVAGMMITGAADAAQSVDLATLMGRTVCRISPNKCYTTTNSAAIDDTVWDDGAGCWGEKYICNVAMGINDQGSRLLPMAKIKSELKSDFDANEINVNYGDCFGARKTRNNGSEVSVDGAWHRVWCANVIADNVNWSDELVKNGQFTLGAEPKCAGLAEYNMAAVLTGAQCYGKYYNESEYRVMCDGETANLVVLNGAREYGDWDGRTPRTQQDANEIFDAMYLASKEQHNK